MASMAYKTPESVLVVIHTPDLQILLLERSDHPGWWQSVTGSLESGETPEQTAVREVSEETGIQADCYSLQNWQYRSIYEIYDCYRHRYAPHVTHNTEHVFSLRVPAVCDVTLSRDEHLQYRWLPANTAAELCFSPSNQAAIRLLSERKS